MKHCMLWMLAVTAAMAPQLASAQAPPATAASSPLSDALVKAKNAQAFSDLMQSLTVIEMPVTATPATFLLGTAGTEVPRVSTYREFATELSSAVGKDGKIARSIAVEINPRLAAGPVLWADYQRSALTEILTRTTVSAATLAADKDGVARGAFGLQSVLYSAEARQAIDAASNGDCKAIADAYAASKDLPKSFGPGKLAEPPIELGSDVVAKCKARVSGLLTKWNPTSVSLGLGQALYSNTGSARKLKSGSSVAWITGTVGFDGNTGDAVEDRMGVGLTAHVRRSLHERVASPSDATMLVDESSTLYGLNVRGGNRKFGALFETSLRRAKATSLLDEKRRRYFLGVEYRLREDLYLVAGVGSDKGRRDGKEDRATLVNLKWGFSEQSVLRKP